MLTYTKISKYFLLFFLLVSFNSIAQNKSSNPPFELSFPTNFPNELKVDIVQLLESSTHFQWKVLQKAQEVKNGFVLKLEYNELFKTKESFSLNSNGTNILIITSSSNEGVIFGIYKHLRTLGFKFYLPDDLYTLIPITQNPFGPKKNIIDQPFAQIRDFFGTGGLGSGNSDESHNVEKSWQLWKWRNGFGAAYTIDGHRGENFILENKEIIAKHPDWLAFAHPTIQSITPGSKLNYLNKEAIDFFTSWTIQQFSNPKYKQISPNFTDLTSIEPSDGGGFINDLYPTKDYPSISDQVFNSANIAANKLDKLFPNNPNIGVSLYAYNTHAAPPTFQLHPRIFVQLIPYQFQNIAFGPSFINMWASKAKRFGIYDYFKYPDAQLDLPGGLTLEQLMLRVKQSIQSGSEGTTFETSYSKFSSGIPLWVVGRYLADGDFDWENNLNTLTNDLYIKESPTIKQVLKIFYTNTSFSPNDFTTVIHLVSNAVNSSRDTVVKRRLLELSQYLFYIHLVLQSQNLTKGSLKDRMLPVAIYAWKIYQSKIIDSYRIMQLVSYSFLNSDKSSPNYSSFHQLHLNWFPETDRKIAAWNFVSQKYNVESVYKDLATLKTLYPNENKTFTGIYQSKPEFLLIPTNFKPIKELIIGGNATNRGYFSIYSDKITKIKIKYHLKTSSPRPRVIISGIDKKFTTPLSFTLSDITGQLEFKLLPGETSLFINSDINTTYRFKINIDNGYIFFDGSPRGKIAFYKNLYDSSESYTYHPDYYPSYIFIPQEINTVQYKTQINSLQLYDFSQRKIETKLLEMQPGDFEIRELKVQNSEAGKLWKALINGNFNYNFLNIPDRYFLFKRE